MVQGTRVVAVRRWTQKKGVQGDRGVEPRKAPGVLVWRASRCGAFAERGRFSGHRIQFWGHSESGVSVRCETQREVRSRQWVCRP